MLSGLGIRKVVRGCNPHKLRGSMCCYMGRKGLLCVIFAALLSSPFVARNYGLPTRGYPRPPNCRQRDGAIRKCAAPVKSGEKDSESKHTHASARARARTHTLPAAPRNTALAGGPRQPDGPLWDLSPSPSLFFRPLSIPLSFPLSLSLSLPLSLNPSHC